MTQLVFALQAKGPNLMPTTYIKKNPGMVYTWNLSCGEAKAGESREIAGYLT